MNEKVLFIIMSACGTIGQTKEIEEKINNSFFRGQKIIIRGPKIKDKCESYLVRSEGQTYTVVVLSCPHTDLALARAEKSVKNLIFELAKKQIKKVTCQASTKEKDKYFFKYHLEGILEENKTLV
jgi:hypothetical protein